MSTATSPSPFTVGGEDPVLFAQTVLRQEGEAVLELAHRLPTQQLRKPFLQAVAAICRCQASVVVCGMGKAGLVGQKIAATLASTGSISHFLHPAEAVHGDLGRIHQNDVVLLLSASGETEEITRLLATLKNLASTTIALTAQSDSTLGKAADITLELGRVSEACWLGLAPSTSTTMMLAMGDALALAVSRLKGFDSADFAQFHPGGSLGKKLALVEEIMRPLDECRLSEDSLSVRQVLVRLRHVSEKGAGRRTGAIMLTDPAGALSGVFTDSDLARLLEQRGDHRLDQSIRMVMTANPQTITAGARAEQALSLIAERKISELPVVDPQRRPVGLIDITDIVGFPANAWGAPLQEIRQVAGNDAPRDRSSRKPSFGEAA